MGAYDNPQMIQTRADQAARGIQMFNQALQATTANLAKQAELNRKRAEEKLKKNEALINKATEGAESDVYELEKNSKLLSGLKDLEGKNIFQKDALMENITLVREKMKKSIEDAGGVDAPLSTITQIRLKYTDQIKTLKQDMDVFVGGLRVYEQMKKDGKSGDVIASYKPEMISIYDSLLNGEGNVGIYPDDKGGFTVSEYNFDDDGENPEPIQPVSLTNYRKDILQREKEGVKDNIYFDTIQKDSLQDVQKHMSDGIKNSKGTAYDFGIYTKRNSKVGGKVDKDINGKVVIKPAFTTYTSLDVPKFREFAKTDQGKNFIQNYYLGKDSKGNQNYDPKALWVGSGNSLSTYSQENLDNFLLERFIKSYDPSQSYSVPVSVEGSDRSIQAGSGGMIDPTTGERSPGRLMSSQF
tara:strand:- start:2684 stop:3919 length:1236 start_codon:yes stop_codon:yes gene_type:complete